jgi:hypothetical protein
MKTTARVLLLPAVFIFPACHAPAPAPSLAPAALLAPSPFLLIGRVVSVDPVRDLAIIELSTSAPTLQPDTELLARADDLSETARLRATRQLRGHTLGANVISGDPRPGDEVVLEKP